MKRNLAMTRWELLIVIVLILMLFVLAIPMLDRHHVGARQPQNSTQVRGIHSSMVLFSQGNNQWYPGLANDGSRVLDPDDEVLFPVEAKRENDRYSSTTQHPGNRNGDTASARLAILLNLFYFSGDYALSPAENKGFVWTTGLLSTNQFSYALLQIDPGTMRSSQGRRESWCAANANSSTVILSDKSIDLDPGMGKTSLWVESSASAVKHPKQWQGSVGWNDNHVSYEYTATMLLTQYGKIENKNDNLFTNTDGSATTANAAMVYN